VLRIVGEALTNARRHSEASQIHVSVQGSDERLCVDVSDNGRGFDPRDRSAVEHGAGIAGMRERARIIAGDLRITSAPDRGTTVRIDLPLGTRGRRLDDDVRILLVDDHAAVREAVARAFQQESGFEIVGQAASLAEAREMLAEVDVAVVDLALPDGYGGDLIEELRDASPQAQALVLTASLDRADLARAVESGAAGFLNKNVHLGEVVAVVRRLRAGEQVMPLTEVVELLRFARRQRRAEHEDRLAMSRLSPREREVLHALAEGLGSDEIAERLHISVRTERNHIASVLAKLGVHSRLQALVFALRYGLVDIR
jgi:DNA-binding NarL/FixJ family response regulator